MTGDFTCHRGLYRRALGAAFDSLPAVLRRFHDASSAVSARGEFRITRGPGALRHVVATIMRLPAAGERVRVHLAIENSSGRERWTRDFGPHRMTTRQWLHREMLIEAAGPLRFGFVLTVEAEEMVFTMTRCWLCRLPLPLPIAPRVHAKVSGGETSWWTTVQIDAPLLGLIARYEGKMIPEC